MDLSLKFALMIVAVIVAVGVDTGDAVQCYVCNSGDQYNGEACADPIDQNKAVELGLVQNCDDEGLKDGKNYTYCRKFLQDVEGDRRVVRTCATSGRIGSCVDRTGTTRIKLRYCECDGDKCNAASTLVAVTSTALLCALSVATLAAFHAV
jgi:hypothetical protein